MQFLALGSKPAEVAMMLRVPPDVIRRWLSTPRFARALFFARLAPQPISLTAFDAFLTKIERRIVERGGLPFDPGHAASPGKANQTPNNHPRRCEEGEP